MNYPLIIDGTVCGSLAVSQSGLYTHMEAQTEAVQSELLRIWVHGGGKSAYLGIMQPWSGGLYLHRRLSRTELAGFPQTIEYASNSAGMKKQAEPEEKQAAACPSPAPIGTDTEELLWTRREDGTLTAFDATGRLLAIPAQLRSDAKGAVIRCIEGKSYMIFRY